MSMDAALATIHYPCDLPTWSTRALDQYKIDPVAAETFTLAQIGIRASSHPYRIRPIFPSWYSEAVRIIQGSTADVRTLDLEGGRWLRPDVANAGLRFLREVADLLPSEPYIYSSGAGDMVADFVAARGTLTSIVGPTFVLVFRVIDGVSLEPKTISRLDKLRSELEPLLKPFLPGSHGEVAAST